MPARNQEEAKRSVRPSNNSVLRNLAAIRRTSAGLGVMQLLNEKLQFSEE